MRLMQLMYPVLGSVQLIKFQNRLCSDLLLSEHWMLLQMSAKAVSRASGDRPLSLVSKSRDLSSSARQRHWVCICRRIPVLSQPCSVFFFFWTSQKFPSPKTVVSQSGPSKLAIESSTEIPQGRFSYPEIGIPSA
ncbi:hypothetical protein LY76DRAFT_80559 [Colletotrichum caudatum]|nr:hypothetical protein LY76DRAFT_80559 [Colletotrichum caudatum]